ncbi:acyl-protein synthetase [Clostridium sp. YIM B02505]|uniref:Acyl-protein synthetase n=1 Tax=Clostridium yunnanense TaxID=2800325 RepID=A0ABS1ETM6_9CLOT|nr:acyl-protein synthetase [Clostridium yunnanense]MBK1812734.1 acyl-protein synthetase [Clostridium yunnanense]
MKKFYEDLKINLVDQYLKCPAYKLLCDNQGFNPAIDLNTEKDVEKVPFITTTVFKKSAEIFTNLLKVPVSTIDKWTVSSSTSGDPSMVGRTMSDIMQIKEFNKLSIGTLRPDTEQECVFYPDPDTMKNYKSEMVYGKRTESYIGNILDVFDFKDNTIFLIKQEGDSLVVEVEEFIKFLENNNNLDKHISIRGSALLLYNTINELKEKIPPFNLGKNVLIQTGGGGWDGKKGTISNGTAISKQEFVETVASFLGVPEENFLDSYSFTENTFFIIGHYSKEYKDYLFHIPSWGKVIIRDIKTLEPLCNPGDRGFMQMLNAYGTSAFAGASIMVDDIGEIVSIDECPDCKEKLMTIRIVGRVKGAEAKGCGATLNVRSEQ